MRFCWHSLPNPCCEDDSDCLSQVHIQLLCTEIFYCSYSYHVFLIQNVRNEGLALDIQVGNYGMPAKTHLTKPSKREGSKSQVLSDYTFVYCHVLILSRIQARLKSFKKVYQLSFDRPNTPHLTLITMLAADFEENAGGKWRAGDPAKSCRAFLRALEVYDNGLTRFPNDFDLAYNKLV